MQSVAVVTFSFFYYEVNQSIVYQLQQRPTSANDRRECDGPV